MKTPLLYMILIMAIISSCNRPQSFENAVTEAVDRQMKNYPESQLSDIYKNFFQDQFGPGHLLADTTGAGNYLRWELDSQECEGPYYELSGYKGNFYRVNLRVIKENLIPYHEFFDCFVESAKNFTMPQVNDWAKEWHRIDAIIQKSGYSFENEDVDRAMIEEVLSQGKYAIHHSKRYDELYHPHYRLIEKKIFEERMKKIIVGNKKN